MLQKRQLGQKHNFVVATLKAYIIVQVATMCLAKARALKMIPQN